MRAPLRTAACVGIRVKRTCESTDSIQSEFRQGHHSEIGAATTPASRTVEMPPAPMKPLPKRSNRFRMRALSAAAAGMSAAATTSEAAAGTIIYTSQTVTTGSTFSIDGTAFSALELVQNTGMGAMGGENLFLDDVDVGMMADSSTIEFAFFPNGAMGMGTAWLDDLTVFGDTVDGTLSFVDTVYLTRNDTTHPNLTADGSTGYIGFTFLEGGANRVYGWMRLTYDSPTSVTAFEWAYDADGDPITVGMVPEPGTALLVGLGLAMLGVAGQRARTATRTVDHD